MEEIIQSTDYDSFSSKIAAIERNYLPPAKNPLVNNDQLNDSIEAIYDNYKSLHQDYLKSIKITKRLMVSRINSQVRHSFPVMNFGTYLRTLSIDYSILNYINQLPKGQNFQIVNMGCGSDLRMVQYLSNYSNLSRFIDLDFKKSVDFKQSILTSSKLGNFNNNIDKYNLIPANLNNVDEIIAILRKFTDISLPTIFITECVLCYIPEKEAQNLIESIHNLYKSGVWISYDPIGGSDPNDNFGKIMKSNLMDSRNLNLPTLLRFTSKELYSNRWCAYSNVIIYNMWEFLELHFTAEEVKRLKSLQFMDEIEELKVMQTHYVILSAQWST